MITMSNRRIHIVIPIVFLLASCPGCRLVIPDLVQHYTALEKAPDVDCIWNRLIEQSKPRKVLTIRDNIPTGVNHSFHLDAEIQPFSVSVFFGDDGSFRYGTTSNALSGTLADLEAARQALVEVDSALNGQCGLGDIVDNVRENCVGESCDQLSAMSN